MNNNNSSILQPKLEKPHILILGGYGGGNLGDEAICQAMVQNIRELHPDSHISIFTLDRQLSEQIIPSIEWLEFQQYPLQIRYALSFDIKNTIKMKRIIDKADIILIGGGGLFYESKFSYCLISHLITWINRIAYLKMMRKKYWLYGISLSRLRTPLARKIIRPILQWSEDIYVRDTFSAELCKKYSGRTAHIMPDLVLSHRIDRNNNKFETRSKKIIIAPRPSPLIMPDQGLKKWVNIISKILIRYPDYTIDLYPFDPRIDADFCHAINNLLNNRCQIIKRISFDIDEITKILANADLIIANPLHAAIFAVRARTPIIALSYDDKVSSVFRDLELENCCLDWHALSDNILINEIIKYIDLLNYEKPKLQYNYDNFEKKCKLPKEALKDIFTSINVNR